MAPITTAFDTFVTREPSLAEVMYRGASADEVYKECVDLKSGDISKFPDRVVTHDVAGLGPMYQRNETGVIQMDTPGPGETKESVFSMFGLGVEFSEVLLDDAMYGIIESVIEDLGRTYNLTRNIQIGQLYDDAFTGFLYKSGDGQPILSTAHSAVMGGPVRKNKLAVDAAFSTTSIQNLVTLMRRQTDDRGNPRPALASGQAIHVIIPPDLEFESDKVFDAGAALQPDVNTNTINVLKKFRWKVTINPYFTSTTNYFLTNPDTKGIWLVDRKPLERSFYEREETKGVVYDARGRWTNHIRTWEHIYGSKA